MVVWMDIRRLNWKRKKKLLYAISLFSMQIKVPPRTSTSFKTISRFVSQRLCQCYIIVHCLCYVILRVCVNIFLFHCGDKSQTKTLFSCNSYWYGVCVCVCARQCEYFKWNGYFYGCGWYKITYMKIIDIEPDRYNYYLFDAHCSVCTWWSNVYIWVHMSFFKKKNVIQSLMLNCYTCGHCYHLKLITYNKHVSFHQTQYNRFKNVHRF